MAARRSACGRFGSTGHGNLGLAELAVFCAHLADVQLGSPYPSICGRLLAPGAKHGQLASPARPGGPGGAGYIRWRRYLALAILVHSGPAGAVGQVSENTKSPFGQPQLKSPFVSKGAGVEST